MRTVTMRTRIRLIAAALLTALNAGCGAAVSHDVTPSASLPPDPRTGPALLKIAAAFNHDYDTGAYDPVYSRWDQRSQAIITRADYVARHQHCASGTRPLSLTESASPGGPAGSWLVRYEIGGQQLTDYWFYQHRRWAFDLPLSNPDAVRLYRMSKSQYFATLGCGH